MNRIITAILVLAMIGTITFVTLGRGTPTEGSGGFELHRISAEWQGPGEIFTSIGAGLVAPNDDGVVVYSKMTPALPAGLMLYVTFSGTGDTHGGAAMWLSCRVNGNACPVSGPAAAPDYINVQKHGITEDFHDNSIHKEWCSNDAVAGPNLIEIRMATSLPGNNVFYESANYYIDAQAAMPDLCVEATPPPGAKEAADNPH